MTEAKKFGIVRKLVEKMPGFSGKKQSFIHGKGDVFHPTYGDEKIMDLKAFDREDEHLANMLGDHLMAEKNFQTIVVRNSPAEVRHAQKSVVLRQSLADRLQAVIQTASELKGEINSGMGVITMDQLYFNQAIQLGAEIVAGDIIRQYHTATIQNVHPKHHADAEQSRRLKEFCFTQETSIMMAGTTLSDLLHPKSSPTRFYHFLQEAVIVRGERKHGDVLKQNKTDLTTQFPNQTKNSIDRAALQGLALAAINPETFNPYISQHEGVTKEAAQQAKTLSEKAHNLLNQLPTVLFDPKHPEFPEFTTLLVKHMTKGSSLLQRLSAMQWLMGGNDTRKIYEIFRKSQALAKDPQNGPIYALVVESVREYIDQISGFARITTADDLDSFFDDNTVSLEPEGSQKTDEMKRIVGKIFSRTSKLEYEVDPSKVELDGIVPPQSINIKFDAHRPQKFVVLFQYRNQVGESLDLDIELDLAKNIFNWSILESPSDSEKLLSFQKALISATKSILLNIGSQAENYYQQKQRPSTVVPPPTSATKQPFIKSRVAEDESNREPKERKQPPAPLTPLQQVLQEGISEETTPNLRKVLKSEPGKTIENLLGKLGSADRAIVAKKIEEFNDRGIGHLERKRQRGNEGEIFYTLSVGCTVPKGVRVLCYEVDSEDNNRIFVIRDIDYRKDIYRNNSL